MPWLERRFEGAGMLIYGRPRWREKEEQGSVGGKEEG